MPAKRSPDSTRRGAPRRRVVFAATLKLRGGGPDALAPLARVVRAAGCAVLSQGPRGDDEAVLELAGGFDDVAAAVTGAARAAARAGAALAAIVVHPVRGARPERTDTLATLIGAQVAQESPGRAARVTVAPWGVDYRVHLDSDDLAVARRLARKLGAKVGGFPAVKAAGERRADGGATVALRLVDPAVTGVITLHAAIEIMGKEAGVDVRDSELVGLVPAAAVPDDAEKEVRLRGFDPARQVIERRLESRTVVDASGPSRTRGGRAAG